MGGLAPDAVLPPLEAISSELKCQPGDLRGYKQEQYQASNKPQKDCAIADDYRHFSPYTKALLWSQQGARHSAFESKILHPHDDLPK